MQQMIDDIEVEVDYTAKMIGRHSFSGRVMEAMRQVPLHAFVAPSQLDEGATKAWRAERGPPHGPT